MADHGTQPEQQATVSTIDAELLRRLIDASPILIWATDASGAGMFVNESWRALTGLEDDDFLGWGWMRALHPDDAARAQEVFQRALDAREHYVTEFRVRRRDGEYIWMRSAGAAGYDDDGEFIGYTGSCIDIDNVMGPVPDDAHLGERLTLAVRGSEDVIWDWTAIGTAEEAFWLSPHFNAVLGLPANATSPVLHELEARIHPDDRNLSMTARADGFARDRYEAVYRILDAAGQYKWLRSRGMVVRDHDGRALRMSGSIQDIDEARRTELEIKELQEKFEAAVAGSQAGLWDWPDVAQDFVWWSPRFYELLGYAEDEITSCYSNYADHLHPDDLPAVERELARCFDGGGVFDMDYRLRRKTGEYRWFRARAIARPDESGTTCRMAGSIHDVDDHKRAEIDLRQLHDKYNTAVEASINGLWDWDIASGYVWCSPSYKRLMGYERGDAVDSTAAILDQVVHPDDLAFVRSALENHIKHGTPYDVEFRGRHRSGIYRWFRGRAEAIRNEEGRAIRMSGSVSDINLRKQAEIALHEEKEKAQVTLASIADAVITTDADGLIEFLNPIAERLLGVPTDRAWHSPADQFFTLIDESTRERVPSPVARCIEEMTVIESSENNVLVSQTGREYAIEYCASPIRREGGRLFGIVLVFKDVTAEREMAREISYQATHDALTGLINRREFEQRLKRVIATSSTGSEDSAHALCYLDLDQFKVVNDTCGHIAGDELLRQVANLLSMHTRRRDTIARLGGDEFGLLMEHCDLGAATRIADVLRQALASHRFHWEDRSYSIGVSIGIVAIDAASESMHTVLRQADAACYAAKDQGRNRLQVYAASDHELQRRHGEMEWVAKINHALERDEFDLFFQRVRSTVVERGDYIEILLRCTDRGQYLEPAQFLPAAQRYGLSTRIDRWVIRRLAEWHAEHPELWATGDLFAINISPLSLGEADFTEFVTEQITSSGLPGEQLCFEITETAAIENLSMANAFFAALKNLGCKFALDDFGSGLSSFGYLRGLPVDFLKIDGSFVRDCATDAIAQAMVKSINDIGQVMGKVTIAEFAETDEILDYLEDIGVDYAQGYAVHRPAPLSTFSSEQTPDAEDTCDPALVSGASATQDTG